MCAFTTDFDRARAGYSPDRLDALVWGLTELLVEPMPHWGIFEYTRQEAEKLTKRHAVEMTGSVEWRARSRASAQRRSVVLAAAGPNVRLAALNGTAQQEQARGTKDHGPSGPVQIFGAVVSGVVLLRGDPVTRSVPCLSE